MRLNRLQRLGLGMDLGGTHALAAIRAIVGGLWRVAGSRQTRNALLACAVLVLVFIAQQMVVAQHHLGSIAEAQQVAGYAVMRQMKAMGWTAESPATVRASAPAAPAQPPHPIDPAQLETASPAKADTVPPAR